MATERTFDLENGLHLSRFGDALIHFIIFAVTMIVLAIIAFFVGRWDWFMAALAGWGIVVIGHAGYIFFVKTDE